MNGPIFVELLDRLKIAVFECIQGDSYILLSKKQAWLSDFLPDLPATSDTVSMPDDLTYLGNFLIDAKPFWQSQAHGKLDSGIWNEVTESGENCQLEARALNLDNRNILIVWVHGFGMTEAQMREQQVKDKLLAFEDLARTDKDLKTYNDRLEAEVQKRTADLSIRIKELNCLFSMSRLIEEQGNSLEAMLKGVVNLVPNGWQYPEITCARLRINGTVYATQNWKDTSWKLESAITLGDQQIGVLEICYLEERPPGDEGPFLREERSLINTICELLGRAMKRHKSEQDLVRSYQTLNKTFEDTLSAFGKIVEVKDPYTSGHQIRVAKLATAIAMEMNLSSELVNNIRMAATVHDIGKIYIPADMLSKPGRLDNLEYQIIQTHVQQGYDILKGIEFPWPIAKIALQHHERLDGSGYPNKLRDDEILVEAKILAVSDVVEAMMTHRPYRPGLGIDAALEEISRKKGVAFDPVTVDTCIALFKEKDFKFE